MGHYIFAGLLAFNSIFLIYFSIKDISRHDKTVFDQPVFYMSKHLVTTNEISLEPLKLNGERVWKCVEQEKIK